jgi:hypothetical protein
MKPEKIVDQIKKLSNPERLAVIEAATRLVREDLAGVNGSANADDPILRVFGSLSFEPISSKEIDEVLYGDDPA